MLITIRQIERYNGRWIIVSRKGGNREKTKKWINKWATNLVNINWFKCKQIVLSWMKEIYIAVLLL